MKNKKNFLALIILLIIFALYIGYRYGGISSENTPTQTTILSGTIVDESQLFHLDYLEQYSWNSLVFNIEEGDVKVSVENRFTWSWEYVYLTAWKSFTLDINDLIQKYQNHIGISIQPVDKKNGVFSLQYKIVWY